jgi:hypothetical protein
VEAFVLAASAPVSPRRPLTLHLCHVVGERRFWAAAGFEFVDPPLNEEAQKRLQPPPHCTCGACAGGVLSQLFARKLAAQAHQEYELLRDGIADWEKRGLFSIAPAGGRGAQRVPLAGATLEQACMEVSSLERCFPRSVRDNGLHKSLLQGLAEAFRAVAAVAEQRAVPTPDAVLRCWQDGHWAGAARTFFLTRGGSVELAIANVIDTVMHLDGDDMFDYLYDDVPPEQRCDNDENAVGVMQAALGSAFTRMPNCVDCGTYEGGGDEAPGGCATQ